MLTTLSKAAGAAILLSAAGEACTVPVFRYALDRWAADAYRLEAPAGWSESDAGQALQKLLKESETPLDIVASDEGAGEARFVMPGEEPEVVWSGRLDESASALFSSPAREELAKRILAGESMVWVMVTSGDEEEDKAFAERMAARLEYLGSVAAIPEQDPNDPESQLGPGPELRVGFSFLKVSRDDAGEEVFRKMLAGPGGKALLEGEGPFAGVVFGRGRVLGAWNAAELDDEGIDEVSLFLLGACSCRVKFQNPGWDLAMAVDWETRLMAAQMAADNALEGEAEAEEEPEEPVASAEPEVVEFHGNDSTATSTDVRTGGISPVLIGGIAAVLIFLSVISIRFAKSR